MKFANGVNTLVARFVRLDYNDELAAEMLVMERIRPIDYRAYEVERRELWFDVFADELTQLHQNGFVHRHLKRPSDLDGLAFDNILLTEQGLRLIDVGISALKSQVGERIFAKYIDIERAEMEPFRAYFWAGNRRPGCCSAKLTHGAKPFGPFSTTKKGPSSNGRAFFTNRRTKRPRPILHRSFFIRPNSCHCPAWRARLG